MAEVCTFTKQELTRLKQLWDCLSVSEMCLDSVVGMLKYKPELLMLFNLAEVYSVLNNAILHCVLRYFQC